MNAKTFAELALKIWGAISILGALLALPPMLWMEWSVAGGDPQAEALRASQISYVLNVIVHFAGGIVVLVWADRIVALFESDETPLHIGMSGREVAVLAFALDASAQLKLPAGLTASTAALGAGGPESIAPAPSTDSESAPRVTPEQLRLRNAAIIAGKRWCSLRCAPMAISAARGRDFHKKQRFISPMRRYRAPSCAR